MLFRLALRNLALHRVKTFLVGGLVVLGVLLNFLGTSLLDALSRNIERTFVEQFTGDLLIRDKNQLSGVFGASGEGGEAAGVPVVKPIPHFEELVNFLDTVAGVAARTQIYVGYGLPNLSEISSDFFLLWGIQPDEFFDFFPGIRVIEGRTLRHGERGLMLHRSVRETLEENYGVDLGPGASLQINNFGVTGIKIRTVPIVGVFEYVRGNERFFLPNLIDVETARLLFDRPSAADLTVTLDPDAASLLGDLSEEDLFGDEIVFAATPTGHDPLQTQSVRPTAPASAPPVNPRRGTWTTVLLRLAPGAAVNQVESTLRAEFEKRGWELEVQDWFGSAQPDSMIALGLRFLLNVVVFLISVVSVLVMMNTLVASILERTAELGTMRALGARRSFISRMLLAETVTLVGVSGAVAVALGTMIIVLLGAIGLPAPDPGLESYFGGPVFRPSLSANAFWNTLSLLVQIAFFSWVFPVATAVKISPLKAMGRE